MLEASSRLPIKGANDWNVATGQENFYNLRAFEHEWTWNDSSNQSASYITHCVEIFQSVSVGSDYVFEVVAIEDVPERPNSGWPGNMGDERARLMRDLYADWANPATGGVNGSAGERDSIASAFQLMIWEITHENFSAVTAEGMVDQISFDLGAIQREFVGSTQDMVGDYLDPDDRIAVGRSSPIRRSCWMDGRIQRSGSVPFRSGTSRSADGSCRWSGIALAGRAPKHTD